jgi:hypothetical protein
VEEPQELPAEAALRDRAVTLVAMDGARLVYATTVGGKRELLAATDGPLWAAWTGQWKTNIFAVARERVVDALS